MRNEGGAGIPVGSSGITAAIAVCTSTAAPSMSRSRLNCRLTLVVPVELREVIESRPAMVVNCRSNTVATADDMVAGSAPGKVALTLMVGKSTFGKSLTPNERKAKMPNMAMPAISRLLAMGRRMKVSERFTLGLVGRHSAV